MNDFNEKEKAAIVESFEARGFKVQFDIDFVILTRNGETKKIKNESFRFMLNLSS